MMNNRLLNFTEYLKEELKIDLSDKKLKANLEALLLVADRAIDEYCKINAAYDLIIEDLMKKEEYADSFLYGVAAMLLSGMNKTEFMNLKQGGKSPSVNLSLNAAKKETLLKKDVLYKSDVEVTKNGQRISNDEFNLINVPGESGEMKASEVLIKITEKNTKDLVSAVGSKKTEVREIISISSSNNGNSFNFVDENIKNPLKLVMLIPPTEGEELSSETPYLEVNKNAIDAILKYSRLEIEAEFAFSGAGTIKGGKFLSMAGWDLSSYTRRGPLKNSNFANKLDIKGLPWWLTYKMGKNGKAWTGERS
jgi:hypothetical protein